VLVHEVERANTFSLVSTTCPPVVGFTDVLSERNSENAEVCWSEYKRCCWSDCSSGIEELIRRVPTSGFHALPTRLSFS